MPGLQAQVAWAEERSLWNLLPSLPEPPKHKGLALADSVWVRQQPPACQHVPAACQ